MYELSSGEIEQVSGALGVMDAIKTFNALYTFGITIKEVGTAAYNAIVSNI